MPASRMPVRPGQAGSRFPLPRRAASRHGTIWRLTPAVPNHTSLLRAPFSDRDLWGELLSSSVLRFLTPRRSALPPKGFAGVEQPFSHRRKHPCLVSLSPLNCLSIPGVAFSLLGNEGGSPLPAQGMLVALGELQPRVPEPAPLSPSRGTGDFALKVPNPPGRRACRHGEGEAPAPRGEKPTQTTVS